MKKALTAAVLLLITSIITALLPWIADRDPAMAVFRAREAERAPDPDVLDNLRTTLDLPTTPWQSISATLSGNFGTSWINPTRSATSIAWSGLGTSVTLAASSTILATALAFALAWPRIRSVTTGRPSRASDITVMAVLGSIPEFVLAVVLLVTFALRLRIAPVSGVSWLPIFALALPSAGLLGRVLLITIDNIGQEEWVRSWRINGVTPRHITTALATRALGTLAPLIVLFFAGTIASTVFVESIFNIPGFGRTALGAALDQDLPVLQVVVLTAVGIGIASGAVAALLRYVILRPLRGAGFGSSLGRDKPKGLVPFILTMTPLVLLLAGLRTEVHITPTDRLLAPSAAHWLGTDQLGRDLLARLAHGAIYTIGTATAVTFVCAIVGLVLGLTGRWAAQVGDTLNALPAVLIGLVLAGVFGGSLWTAAGAVVLVGWIPLAAHAASVAAEARNTGYYQWAALSGAGLGRLVRVHLMPTVVPAVARHAASRIAHNALALAGLGFLGLGAPHDSPEWGVVLSESIRYAERAPWMMAAPTLLLILLGVAAALATDTRLKR